jgi:hypothetical protein
VDATVELVQVTGTRMIITLALGTVNMVADFEVGEPLLAGQKIPIEFDMTRAGFFDRETGLAMASPTARTRGGPT